MMTNLLGVEESAEFCQKHIRSNKYHDDIPVPVMNKNFKHLIEEAITAADSNVVVNSNKPKKQFLRKGQGLERFKSKKSSCGKAALNAKSKTEKGKPSSQFSLNSRQEKTEKKNFLQQKMEPTRCHTKLSTSAKRSCSIPNTKEGSNQNKETTMQSEETQDRLALLPIDFKDKTVKSLRQQTTLNSISEVGFIVNDLEDATTVADDTSNPSKDVSQHFHSESSVMQQKAFQKIDANDTVDDSFLKTISSDGRRETAELHLFEWLELQARRSSVSSVQSLETPSLLVSNEQNNIRRSGYQSIGYYNTWHRTDSDANKTESSSCASSDDCLSREQEEIFLESVGPKMCYLQDSQDGSKAVEVKGDHCINVRYSWISQDSMTEVSNSAQNIDVSESRASNNFVFCEEMYDKDVKDNLKSELLIKRLCELEKQITIYETHNANLAKLQRDYEIATDELIAERRKFEEWLVKEKLNIRNMSATEMEKIAAEKRALEEMYKSNMNELRMEREELENYRMQIMQMQKEMSQMSDNTEIHHRMSLPSEECSRCRDKSLREEVFSDDTSKPDECKKSISRDGTKEIRIHNDTHENDVLIIRDIFPNKRLTSKVLQQNTWSNQIPKKKSILKNSRIPESRLYKLNSSHLPTRKRSSHKLLSGEHLFPDDVEDEKEISTVESVSSDGRSSGDSSGSENNSVVSVNSCHKISAFTNMSGLNEGNSRQISEISSPKEVDLEKTKGILYWAQLQPSSGASTLGTMQEPPNSMSAEDIVRIKTLENGTKEIWYRQGTVHKISADVGGTDKVIYYNGDVLERSKSQKTEKYFFAESKIWMTTYSDESQLMEFPNGQTETKKSDGTVEICYPEGNRQTIFADGRIEWAMEDGTQCVVEKSGEKVLFFPNGQREIHTKDHKRREYPDGTIKFVYCDGTTETRYANGRVRIKDQNGKLTYDSGLQGT